MRAEKFRGTRLAALALLLALQATAHTTAADLANLSLEQLMQEPVTSVSKKETKLSDAAAAVAVITQDDIRRLGIGTLPEALRLVPGLDVAQISANEWAVSSRGFNDQSANKLLVLIDGRTVYTPGSAGVYWDAQDVFIEDVDRIEVIRGPGATLWGANAVNGVINVITRRAQDTQGALLVGGGGSLDDAVAGARYGTRLGDAYVRGYVKYLDQGSLRDSTHSIDTGNWRTLRAGFRTDWASPSGNDFTLQGDVYGGSAGHVVPAQGIFSTGQTGVSMPEDNNGTNLLGRWTHTYRSGSALSVQAYVDRVRQGYDLGAEHLTTYDIELQHNFTWAGINDIVWGAGYRYSLVAETSRSPALIWTPQQRDIHLYNVFLQDQIALIPSRLNLILGSKFEHNCLSGGNFEPNIRLSVTPSDHQTLWLAASRAIRTPSIFELDGAADVGNLRLGPGATPISVTVVPNDGLRAGKLTAYELGYRISPTSVLSFDFVGFLNVYHDEVVAISQGIQPSTVQPSQFILPFAQENALRARTHGVEASAHWQVLRDWQVSASYTWISLSVPIQPRIESQSPRHQAQLSSYVDLPHQLELNAALFYVGSVVEPAGVTTVTIPSYVRADLGLTWRSASGLSLGLWGRNLFDRNHLEFANQTTTLLTPLPRSIFGKVTWSF